MKYETFDEWFQSLEGFHLLSERFYEEYELTKDNGPTRMVEWLEAAFEAGKESNNDHSKTS